MTSVLRLNFCDLTCPEHLELYSLPVVERILKNAGMKIVDVVMNNINGGSFAVTAVRATNRTIKPNLAVINWLLKQVRV